jgi:hypothetical protein
MNHLHKMFCTEFLHAEICPIPGNDKRRYAFLQSLTLQNEWQLMQFQNINWTSEQYLSSGFGTLGSICYVRSADTTKLFTVGSSQPCTWY